MKQKKAEVDEEMWFWLILGGLILLLLLLITIFFAKSGNPIIDRIKSIFGIFR